MCDRFHCLPDRLLEQDAGLLRMLRLEELAGPPPGGEEMWEEGWHGQ